MWNFFPGKLRSLVIFLRNLVQFFQYFDDKNEIWQKTISTVVKTRLCASVGTFWGNTCSSEKNPMSNSLQIFSGFLFFLSFFGMIIKKASLCPNESIEGKCFFFGKKNVFEFFSALERGIVILWRWISNRLSKMRLVCLEEIFLKEIVSFLKIFLTVWYFLSEIERNFLKSFKKMEFWPEKIVTLVIAGFHASRELFPDFFPGKE